MPTPVSWPDRVEYRWEDPTTGTPYSLYFDDIRSCIAFVVSQGNNLRSADDILESLFDPETGKSLADSSSDASTDDVVAAVPAGTILPDPAPVPEEPEVPVDPTQPTSTETTGTANIVPTASPVSTPTPTGQDSITSGPESYAAPTSPVEAAPVTETDTPAQYDGPQSSPYVDFTPDADTAGVTSNPTLDTPAPSDAPENTLDDSEDVDFDGSDKPETEETAPTIGQPITETDGITGTSGTN